VAPVRAFVFDAYGTLFDVHSLIDGVPWSYGGQASGACSIAGAATSSSSVNPAAAVGLRSAYHRTASSASSSAWSRYSSL